MKGCVGVSECLGTDLFHKFQTSRYDEILFMPWYRIQMAGDRGTVCFHYGCSCH